MLRPRIQAGSVFESQNCKGFNLINYCTKDDICRSSIPCDEVFLDLSEPEEHLESKPTNSVGTNVISLLICVPLMR